MERVEVSLSDKDRFLIRQLVAAVDRLSPLPVVDGGLRRLVEAQVRADPGGLF